MIPRKQAAIDYKEVQHIVKEATEGNTYIKAADHWEHIADFLGHLVAASFASPELNAKTPPGYDFLPHVAFPHPNGESRGRTALAKDIVQAMGAHVKHQVFALVVWRYFNTKEAWEKLRPLLVQFAHNPETDGTESKVEDVEKLKKNIEGIYGDNKEKSYLFSTGDGIRSTAGAGSWRQAVTKNIGAWWDASQRAADILSSQKTTPESWHRAFIEEIVPALPCFGLDYWPKFIYGDIGHHVAPDKVDLMRYTIVGIGPRTLFQSWGIDMPKNGKRAQEVGLQVIRELQHIVAAVYDSGKHAGIEAAKKEANLRHLSAYDVQVQGCECKRGHKLPGRIAKARAPLPAIETMESH